VPTQLRRKRDVREGVQGVNTWKNEKEDEQGVRDNSVDQNLSDFVRKHVDEVRAEYRSVRLERWNDKR
jgi:hypothetical protein